MSNRRFPLPKINKFDVKGILSERETTRGVEYLTLLNDGRKLWYPSSKLKIVWDKVIDFHHSRKLDQGDEMEEIVTKRRGGICLNNLDEITSEEE